MQQDETSTAATMTAAPTPYFAAAVPGILISNPDQIATSETATMITSAGGILPDAYVWGFVITVVAVGIILNFLAICTLFWAKCNGARYFLLQLSFCDVGTLMVCGVDLWYINHHKWVLPFELCPVYLGLETFTSTATIYFITAINFHAISTYNLAIKMNHKGDSTDHEYTELSTEPTDDESGEVGPHQNRFLTIDYSKKKTKVSVILPALFIWFLAASVSIPLFVFGNVIPNDFSPQVCGVINFDKHSNHIMQIFLILVRIVVPILCLHSTVICAGVKLFLARSKLKRKCEVDEDIRAILKLAVILSISYGVFSLQRIYGSLYFELISKPFTHYKYPVLEPMVGLGLAMVGFVIPCLRPCIYYAVDKGLRSAVSGSSTSVRERTAENQA